MRIHGPAAAAALALAMVGSACAGSEVGKCASDADCDAGATCQQELCVEDPGGAGGQPGCSSDTQCAAGQHCAEQACVADPTPVALLVADAQGARLGADVALDASASSLEGGGALSFAFTLAPADAGTLTATAGEPAATLRLTKAHTDAVVTVTVTGPSGLTATATVAIASENSPPAVELTGPAAPVQPGEAGTFQAVATDADGDVSTFLWAVTPAGAQVTSDGATATVTPDATIAADAAYEVTVTADDGQGGQTAAGLTLQAHNLPPTLELPVPAEAEHRCGAAECSATAPLAAAGSDAQPVTYAWRLVSGLADVTATFEPADAAATTVTLARSTVGLIAGSYQLEVTATDALGGSATRQVELLVGNRPPVVQAHDGSELTHGYDAATSVYFADRLPGAVATFVDPDGDPADPASIQWSSTPGVGFSDARALDPALRLEQAVAADLLSMSVTLTAADNQGASAADTQPIPVGNRAPVISAFRGDGSIGHSWVSGNPGSIAKVLRASTFDATDPDGDPLSHEVLVDPADPNAAARGVTAGLHNGEPALLAPLAAMEGNFTSLIRVQDAFGAAATSEPGLVTFTNRSPIVVAAPGARTFLARGCTTVSCCMGPVGAQTCADIDVATRDATDALIAGAMVVERTVSFEDPDGDPLPEASWMLVGSDLASPRIALPPGSARTAFPGTGACVFGGLLGSAVWECTAELALHASVLVGPSTCVDSRGSRIGAAADIRVAVGDPFGAYGDDQFALSVTDDPADATCP